MKTSVKLALGYGAVFTLGYAAALSLGYRTGRLSHTIDAAYQDIDVVFLVMCWLTGLSVIYLMGMWHGGRLESLAAQSEEAAFYPLATEIRVDGRDELAATAIAVEKLRVELAQGIQARNQLMADAAHELRTPLTILHARLESMIERVDPMRPEQLLPLLDETRRMSKLIQDLQQLSLAEAGQLMLDRKWMDLAGHIQEICQVLRIEAEEKAITLVWNGNISGEIYLDPIRMKQVLINLIGNGIRYTPPGGRIIVSALRLEEQVHIDIQDNGPGIPHENLPYLFQRFYRVDGSRNRRLGGTGLGLAIAKQFVEAHRGTIAVSSEPGRGSTFTVRLPVFPES